MTAPASREGQSAHWAPLCLMPEVREQGLLKLSTSPAPADLLPSQAAPAPHLGPLSTSIIPGCSLEGLLLGEMVL